MKKQKVERKDYISLVIDDITYSTQTHKKHAARKAYRPPDPKSVTSFMPGTIQKVFVTKGAKVKEGDQLCILEAMKMKNIIIAPMDGVIKKINIKEGAMVPKNHPLVELK